MQERGASSLTVRKLDGNPPGMLPEYKKARDKKTKDKKTRGGRRKVGKIIGRRASEQVHEKIGKRAEVRWPARGDDGKGTERRGPTKFRKRETADMSALEQNEA